MSKVSSNVGTEKIFENDKVIIWNFELKPGEETPMHRHDKSYVWYAIQGAPLDLEDDKGNNLGVLEVPTNSVFNIKCDGGELEVLSEVGKGAKIPVTHKAKNVGKETYREILIEFK